MEDKVPTYLHFQYRCAPHSSCSTRALTLSGLERPLGLPRLQGSALGHMAWKGRSLSFLCAAHVQRYRVQRSSCDRFNEAVPSIGRYLPSIGRRSSLGPRQPYSE